MSHITPNFREDDPLLDVYKDDGHRSSRAAAYDDRVFFTSPLLDSDVEATVVRMERQLAN